MRKLILLLYLFLYSGLAAAGLDEATAAYKTGDYKAAAKEYKRLAYEGDAKAQFCIGWMYYTGKGVTQNLVQAHKWASLSANYGEKESTEFLELLVKKMTPSQVKLAERLAREWLTKYKKS